MKLRPALSTLALALATALAAALAPGCASIDDRLAAARRADDAALAATPWPEDAAWIVAAAGTLTGADDLESALATHPEALHRYVFQPGEQGETLLTLAYHPGRGVIAGRAAATALGVTFRRDVRGKTIVVRDTRRVEAGEDATLMIRIAAIEGGAAFAVPAVIDPSFDGSLLVGPSIAETLRLERFEIPGGADIHVALGRPFLGTRTRMNVAIPQLGVQADVEAVVPR